METIEKDVRAAVSLGKETAFNDPLAHYGLTKLIAQGLKYAEIKNKNS